MHEALTHLPEWLAEGQLALDEGRHRDAALAFGRAAAALPTEWALHQMTANAWRLAGDVVQARDALRFAFRAGQPAAIESLFTLGTALLETGAPSEARACFNAVLARRPRDPAALGALAAAQRADGDPAGAWPHIQQALSLSHEAPALLLTAAQVRHSHGDTAGALQWLAKAEQVRPGHPLQQLQRAFSLLIEGATAPGWAAFEARGLPSLPPGARDWYGEPLAGQTIAVVMEQGLGDLFQFVRFVRRLEALGPDRVVVEAPSSAVSLLRASGFDAVPSGELPPTDWAVPLLSLPHRLGSDRDTGTDLVPYLRTDFSPTPETSDPTQRVEPRVGIVFRGNPAFLSTSLRDLPSEALAELLGIGGVRWVWLQYDESPTPGEHMPKYLETPPLSGNWLDTAHLVQTLDAVVSVDTAVAHLAGALNIPHFVLLPFSPDWRWGIRSDRTAWYPSARLARQPGPRDWTGAVSQLRTWLAGPVVTQ